MDKKKAILVVSFGTSYQDEGSLSIGAIENNIAEEFAEFEVRRAFTSQMVINILKKRGFVKVENVTEALDRALEDGITTLVVQPTHLMEGDDYLKLKNVLNEYRDKFEKFVLSAPLLTSETDFQKIAEVIVKEAAAYDSSESAICFVGHGNETNSSEVYEKLQAVLREKGYQNYYVGTLKATPLCEDILAEIDKTHTYQKVVLFPFMIVAGAHAKNDMAGEQDGTWKDIFTKAGYEVECVMRGIGQYKEIQEMFAEHVRAAIDSAIKE